MQVSSKLMREEGGYLWWCPACSKLHFLPDECEFNHNYEWPTFRPDITYSQPFPGFQHVCHYVVTNGIVSYGTDSDHDLAGVMIEMPILPPQHRPRPN